MNEYMCRISFWWHSKPRSVKFVGIGFGLMIITTVMASLSNILIWMLFAGTIGISGLVLFVMGIWYGLADLYNSFKKPKLSNNKL